MTTPEQYVVLETLERTTSAFSLAGCAFILLTFFCFPVFRKPINRLVVYASVGNVLTSVATIMSVTAIPSHGGSLAACRFQGFFIQMFMPADSLWILCMALNVHLTFFHNYNAVDLRRLEIRYAIACYGIPFIPALVYLILDQSSLKTGIYDDAVLWCWVGSKWEWMRIAFFYAPVWFIIFTTLAFYIITGRVIFKQRSALRAFSRSTTEPLTLVDNPFVTGNPNVVTAVTEVVVTTEAINADDNLKTGSSLDAESRSSFSSTRKLSSTAPQHTSAHDNRHSHNVDFSAPPSRYQRFEPDNAVWPYSNAVNGAQGDTKNVFLTSVSAGGAPPAEAFLDLEGRRPASAVRKASRTAARTAHANDAAWGYAKVAFLMFVALFIVWVPSTVNRVYALVHPHHTNFALNLTAAFVLPMQGFWNFIIYMSTSWPQCKDTYRRIRASLRRRRSSGRGSAYDGASLRSANRLGPGAGGRPGIVRKDTASTTAGLTLNGSSTYVPEVPRSPGKMQRSGSHSGRMSLSEALDMEDGNEKDTNPSPGSSRPSSGERKLGKY